MAADEHDKLSYIIDKGAVNIVQDYFKLLENVETFISNSKMNVQQICEVAGVSEWQLYRRKIKPELWTKDELVKLFSHLNMRTEILTAPAIAEVKPAQDVPSPFLGPRADSKTIADFRAQKMSLLDGSFPTDQTREMVAQYYNAVKSNILKDVNSETLLITVPSGSGENKIPILFARQLAEETGATVLPEGMISKLHKGEAKLNLSLDKRVHDPIRYEINYASKLKALASTFDKVVVVDDLMNSGESSIRLRKTLEQNGVKVHAFANLVSVENRYPSLADLERVFRKISDLATLTLSDKLKLKSDLPAVFSDYTKQKLNYVERSLRDQKSAVTAFKSISKAAALENKLNKSQDQNMTL